MLPSRQPSLRPVDVVVALHLVLRPEDGYETVAELLGIGLGSGHRSVKRLMAARLVLPHRRAVNRQILLDFLIYGVPHAFYAVVGAEAQGVPTAHAGPLLSEHIESAGVIVWPSVEGRSRGESLVPLYEGAAGLVSRAPELYGLLTLVDALRVGRARERRLARELLEARLREGPAQ
ncbi:MAG: hypothetical protein EA421_09635 [Gemmatimonadales bacterium]|jgi:hypothetical protein|nr:MAG: hypothetical protein EA421_09635 [Gemmatimonadales bacterium]